MAARDGRGGGRGVVTPLRAHFGAHIATGAASLG